MTPQQKIKHLIINRIANWKKQPLPEVTASNVDEVFENLKDVWDAQNEIREGEVQTNIPSEYSRHYDSKSVAAQAPDGSWVGWTYWHGGGKHGCPEEIEWIDEAYDLNCVEEEKMVVVRTFSKAKS